MGWLFKQEIFSFFNVEDMNNDDEMLLELYIPRIKLKRKVYTINSSLNDVDYNVEILDSSDIGNNLYFLAAHSGNGDTSYFDNLVYLEFGDFIFIEMNDFEYVFMVDELFYIQKNGYFSVSYNSEGNTLFLITCSLKYVNRQLVVRAKLIYEC